MSTVLELNNISHSFKSPDGNILRPVLTDINLAVSRGESIGIMGPSGSGKSTLLNIIGTLLKPDSGNVTLENQDVYSQSKKTLSTFRNQKFGFVFQMHHLLPQCTTLENILIPALADARGKVKDKIVQHAREISETIGLADRLDDLPGRLSGGELQRVAIARALVNKPLVLLADEPTGALDTETAVQIGDLLVKLNLDQKMTLITVTHSEELAFRMSRVFQLKSGKMFEAVLQK